MFDRSVSSWTAAFVVASVLVLGTPAAAGDGSGGEEGPPLELLRPSYGSLPRASQSATEYVNTNPLPVPDGQCSTGWVSSVITVPDSDTIADLNVGIWVEHPFRGDLRIRLRAPDDTTVTLIDGRGGGADNLNVLFDDWAPTGPDTKDHLPPPPYYTDHTWQPAQPLSAFQGVALAGDWTLDLCDLYAVDTGTLHQWSLFVETSPVLLYPTERFARACPGTTVGYNLRVYNGTGTSQAFTLTYTGNTWTVTGPTATSTLAAGGEEAIVFTHDVPPEAAVTDADTVVVTATGTEANSATATTEVPLVAGWFDLAPLTPVARPTSNPSVVHVGGKLYKIGGRDTAPRSYLDIYDIATDTWTTGANMPAASSQQDCVGIGDRIYCAGGWGSLGRDDLFIYDIPTNSWSTGAPMNQVAHAYSGVALDGRYYVIGGFVDGAVSTVRIYDPVLNTWDYSAPSMGAPRQFAHAGVIGGKIVVAGGSDDSIVASAEMYDPATRTWSPAASMPLPWVNGADGVLFDRFLVIAGGHPASMSRASNVVWVYDAVNNQWTSSVMAHPLYLAEADSDGSTYWIASGTGWEGTSFAAPWTTRSVTCADRTDLAITKDDGVTEAVAGLPVTYTITATNNGPEPVRGATVHDAFPSLTGVTWTCVATGDSSCTASGAGAIDDSVDLEVGDAAIYVATGDLASSATGTLDNTASVGREDVPDLTPSNNETTDSDTIVRHVDLDISVTDGMARVTLGQTVTYTVEVCNSGPSDALGCTVTDVFDPFFVDPTWTCSGQDGGVCTPSGTGSIDDIVDLPVLACATYTATGTVGFDAPGGPNDNVATVTPAADVTELDPTDNTAVDLTEILAADLSVTKDDGIDEVAPGDPVRYTIIASNGGPSDVTGARVFDAFTSDLVDVAWTCAGAGGGLCAAAGTGDIDDVVDLPVGATVTYTVDATVNPGARGTVVDGRPALVNTAQVISPFDVADGDLADNVATDVDTIPITDVDLTITKGDGACFVLPGGTTTYTITVTNLGPAPAVDATVVDTFPADVESVAWTCVASAGASCTANGTGNLDDTVTVPVFGSVVYTANATVDAFAGGRLVNTATVAPAMGITDLDLTNNSATDSDALELPMFCDGFESGTTDAWSSVMP